MWRLIRQLGCVGAGVLLLAMTTGCESMARHFFRLDFRAMIREVIDTCQPGMPPNPELEKIRKEHYRKWPPQIRKAVDEHEVMVGMDKLQVQLALRLVESLISKRIEGAVETWLLWYSHDGWVYAPVRYRREALIRFQDGKVIEVVRK